VVLAEALAAADDTEPDRLVQGEAGRVLGEDAGLDGPDPGRFGRVDQRRHQQPGDPATASSRIDIDRVLDHARVDLAARDRADRHPADHVAADQRHVPVIGQAGGIEVGPAWRAGLEGRVAFAYSGLIDGQNPFSVPGRHRLNPDRTTRPLFPAYAHIDAYEDVIMTEVHDLDYLAHIASESARFGTVMAGTAPDARVPTCPDWDADDLLWHLGEVQWFWGTIVREGVDGNQAQELKPDRPADRAGLAEFYRKVSSDLGAILAATPSQTQVWTWADDKTAGFVRRRQAHEALIHRIDAELTAGDRSEMDPLLSADGIDEALRLMYGGTVPDWGTFTPEEGKTVRITAADTGGSWFITLGHFTGTDPETQKSYDEPAIYAADADPGTPAAATITGSAADLDCWLWHRPPTGAIDRSGDQDVLAAFDAKIAGGIN
jgi:uncharacterized protein (TIGR03083 family)